MFEGLSYQFFKHEDIVKNHFYCILNLKIKKAPQVLL